MSSNKEIVVHGGDSQSLRFIVKDKDKQPFPVTTYSIRFTIFKTVENEAVLELDSTDVSPQIIKDVTNTNEFVVTLKPSQTAELEYRHKYKVQLYKGTDSESYTVAFGDFTVTQDGE